MLLLHTAFWFTVYFLMPSSLVSCKVYDYLSNTEYEMVEFQLPSWPDYLPRLLKWKVELWSPERKSPQLFELSAQEKSFVQKVRKNELLGISVKPVTQIQGTSSSFFKEAGALYPAACREIKLGQSYLELTWTGGYASAVFKKLIKAAYKGGQSSTYINSYLSAFNWERFLELLTERQAEEGKYFFNPWLLDSQTLLEAISYQNFTASRVRLSEVFSLALEFPLFSSYVPENSSSFTGQEAGNITLRKNEAALFALPSSQRSSFAVIIKGSSEKNISLEFISMPIYIEET